MNLEATGKLKKGIIVASGASLVGLKPAADLSIGDTSCDERGDVNSGDASSEARGASKVGTKPAEVGGL